MNARLVVATGQGGLEDHVSPIFGRAATFTLVELEDGRVADVSVMRNPHQDAPSGAGTQAAQFVAEKRPQAVLAGNFGPNVSRVLSQAGVDMIAVSGMTVGEAAAACASGELSAPKDAAQTPGAGVGDRSVGDVSPRRGGGRGMGHGAGRDRGAGMEGAMRDDAPFAPEEPVGPNLLKERVAQLESELQTVKRKLSELEGGR